LRISNISSAILDNPEVRLLDSTGPILEEALKSNRLTETDVAEFEHFFYERPAFKLINRYVQPKSGDLEIHIHAHGKRGLTFGSVHILDGTNKSEPSLELNFAVTVNGTIELNTLDVIPLNLLSALSLDAQEPQLKRTRNSYLLLLEFRNVWIRPLDLILKEPDGSIIITKTLETSQIERVPIVLPQLSLPTEVIAKAPPQKQVGRQVLSINIEQTHSLREIWWYRQEILNSIMAAWVERGKSRCSGAVELRGISLNGRQLQIVKASSVNASATSNLVLDKSGQSVYTLNVEVRNHGG